PALATQAFPGDPLAGAADNPDAELIRLVEDWFIAGEEVRRLASRRMRKHGLSVGTSWRRKFPMPFAYLRTAARSWRRNKSGRRRRSTDWHCRPALSRWVTRP